MSTVFTPKVKRMMVAESISDVEMREMLAKSAITRVRGMNRRFLDWVFLTNSYAGITTVKDVGSYELLAVGSGPEHMQEDCPRCGGEGCGHCRWNGQIVRRF